MTKVEHGQTIFDIAVQETGTAESIFELALMNGLSLTDELQAGQELDAATEMQNKIILKNFVGKKINSHVNSSPVDERAGGIGYMGIQIDFIVS